MNLPSSVEACHVNVNLPSRNIVSLPCMFPLLIILMQNTMAEQNVPAQAPTRTDEQILGYPEPVEFVSNIRVNYVYQPWRAILTLINQCLTGKTSGIDKPRHPVLQMLWGIVTRTNVDHAELLWEEFTQGIQTFFSHKATPAPTKKPSKHKLPQKVRKGKPTFQLVDEDDEAQQESVPQEEGDDPDLELAKKMSLEAHQEKGEGEGADADMERAIKLSLDPAFLPQGRAPVGGVTIRDPVSETTPKLPEVVGKGKAIVTEEQVAHSLIDLSKKKRTTDQFILVRRDQAPHDSTTGPSSQPEDDTSEKVIHESSSTSDSERTESETEAAAPKGDKDQGEVDSSRVTSGVSIPVSTQGQAGSDPEKAHEALAGPDPEPMQEDQTGSDSGKVHVSLAGPNPEHMDDEFLATAYPKVHENLKLITDERVIDDNPESHSGSMSSMKNLEDTDNFGDQFLYDKPTEDDQEKSKVVDESDSTIPDPSHQTVTSTPPVIAPFTEFSYPKPSSLVTPPPINTEATTITPSLPEITPFIALQLRVARLEQEMSEVKKSDHSTNVLASIKSQVPTAVDKYLGTKLDDALLKVLERHTADLIEKYSVLPGPESIQNQESEKSPKEIIRIKREQGEEKQDSTYSIRSTDKVDLEEFDLKSALFKHMNKNSLANKTTTNYRLYHALMGSFDKRMKTHMDKGPSVTNLGRSTKTRRSILPLLGSAKPPTKVMSKFKETRESEGNLLQTNPTLSSTVMDEGNDSDMEDTDTTLQFTKVVDTTWRNAISCDKNKVDLYNPEESSILRNVYVFYLNYVPLRRITQVSGSVTFSLAFEELVPTLRVVMNADYDISAALWHHSWWFREVEFYFNKHSESSDVKHVSRSQLRILSVDQVSVLNIKKASAIMPNDRTQISLSLSSKLWGYETVPTYYFKEDYTIVPKPRAVVYRDRKNNKGMEALGSGSVDDKREAKTSSQLISRERLQIEGSIDESRKLCRRRGNRVNSYAARITKMIADIEDRHHGPSDAMHNLLSHQLILNKGGSCSRLRLLKPKRTYLSLEQEIVNLSVRDTISILWSSHTIVGIKSILRGLVYLVVVPETFEVSKAFRKLDVHVIFTCAQEGDPLQDEYIPHFNSNNDAEYEALLAGLRIATEMQVKDIHAFVDSKLAASQVEGSYEAKGERMIKYREKVLELAGAFNRFRITHIPRAENRKADALSKLAAVQFVHLSKEVLVEVLNERSVEAQEVNMVVEEEGPTWNVMEKIRNYTMEDGVLYRKSYLVPLMRCVGPLQANYVIIEVHMGSYGIHDGPRQVVAKAMNLGYYWPSMHRDARELIRTYDDCQAHASIPRLPKANMILAEEVPNVLWAHRIIKKTNNGETPFSLTFDTEAVIPAEIGKPTHRTSNLNEKTNDQELRLNLNLLEEQREIAAIRETRFRSKYHGRGKRYPRMDHDCKLEGATCKAPEYLYFYYVSLPKKQFSKYRLAPEVTLDTIDVLFLLA
ncbi:reverse transcriptase domain-containing protein [Tanacetum coccineum]|uniref:Reverse transcriptase domain-containing protein n=1 Tax=Tanacetum coccineum TaxID=301880 RepID=A0ABQ5AG90_9ASTR